jgi:hypothetical protein
MVLLAKGPELFKLKWGKERIGRVMIRGWTNKRDGKGM